MKIAFVSTFCTVLGLFFLKECNSAPRNQMASSSSSNKDFDIGMGPNKIRCLVSIRFINNSIHEFMCNAALVTMTKVLAARICVHRIPSKGLENFRVWVGESLEVDPNGEELARAKEIEHVFFDSDLNSIYASELALVVLKNSAEILRVKQYGKLYRAIDANVNDQVQICETKPPGIIDISENMSFRMEQKEPGDNQTLELSVNYSDGVHSFNSTAVLALSALTKDEVNANRGRIWGTLLFSGKHLLGLGLRNKILPYDGNNDDTIVVDVFARVAHKRMDVLLNELEDSASESKKALKRLQCFRS